jgi:hypothetical protein
MHTTTPDPRRYVLRSPGSSVTVMGPLTRTNVYLTAYPALLPDQPAIDELAPWERTRATYGLSGTRAEYDIWRIDDAIDTKTFVVLVPKPGTRPEAVILPGSGIVAASVEHDQVKVYYEGNKYGAEAMQDYAKRVLHAAGRLDKHYPTIAFGVWATADFDVVGTFTFDADWRTHELTISNQALVDQWTATEPIDPAVCSACGHVKYEKTFQRDRCPACNQSGRWKPVTTVDQRTP